MYCRSCKKELSDLAVVCPACGCAPKSGNKFCSNCGNDATATTGICIKCGCAFGGLSSDMSEKSDKTRMAYILLGCLLGLILPGIHNVYIGNVGKGMWQLLLTICSCWILWIVAYIFTIIDVCTILKDSDGKLLS